MKVWKVRLYRERKKIIILKVWTEQRVCVEEKYVGTKVLY